MDDDAGPRYSREHILVGLQEAWPQIVGDRRPFSSGTRIDHQLKASGDWEEVDLTDVAYALDRFFGIDECDPRRSWKERLEEWTRFFDWGAQATPEGWGRDVGPCFTFGALADFLAARVVERPIEAVRVLGKPCLNAGAFLRICELTARLVPAVSPIWPSTPVRTALRGRALRRLWARLRWMSNGRIAPLRLTWRARLADLLLSRIGLVALLFAPLAIGVWVSAGSGRGGYVPVMLSVVPLWGALLVLGEAWAALEHPLPSGFTTFRDLARGLAASTSAGHRQDDAPTD
jgi:hypothetical protein